ncbi:MAG: hypothetical protein ABI639_12110 [Thermoanaerobaculia bacterium]
MSLLIRASRRSLLVLLFAQLAFFVPAVRADDGDLDLSFGLFGRAVRGSGAAYEVLARVDGSLRLAIRSGSDVGVLALKENGAVDHSFGDDGLRMTPVFPGGDTSDQVVALFERPTGDLLLVVQADDEGLGTGTEPVLVQLTADGELDESFGGDGIRTLVGDSETHVYAAALQSDGKVVLAGLCAGCVESGHEDTFVARFLTTGAADPAFGGAVRAGFVFFNASELGEKYDYATSVAIDDSGKIVLGGQTDLDEDQYPYVARRLSNGSPDPSFSGSNGIQTLLDLPFQHVTALAVDPVTDRVMVATGRGSAQYPIENQDGAVVRLTATGALDNEWSGDGIFPFDLEEGTYLSRLLIQTDGKVVAAGSINANGSPTNDFLFARFRTSGIYDVTFDGNGLRRIKFDLETDGRDWCESATLSGGRIVAIGVATEGMGVNIAVLRVDIALVFAGGFESHNTHGWLGS